MIPILKAVGDVDVFNSMKPGAADSVIQQFKQIETQGTLMTKSLREIGVSEDVLFQHLPGFGNYTLEQLDTMAPQIQRMIQERMFPKDVLAHALEAAVAGTEGGTLGTMTDLGAHSLSGLMTRISDLPTEYMSHLEGMKPVQDFMSNLATVLSPESTQGKEIQAHANAIFEDITDKLFGPLSGPDGAQKIANFVDLALDELDKFIGWVQNTGWPAVETFGSVIGDVFDGIEAIWPTIEDLGSGVGTIFDGVMSVVGPLVGIIKDMDSAFNDGHDSMFSFKEVAEAIAIPLEGVGAFLGAIRDTLEAISMWVEQHEEEVAEFFSSLPGSDWFFGGDDTNVGKLQSGRIHHAHQLQAHIPTAPPPPGANAWAFRNEGGVRHQTANITVNVQGGDGDQIAKHVHDGVSRAFDTMNAEQGGQP
jgi:hypothetical protein